MSFLLNKIKLQNLVLLFSTIILIPFVLLLKYYQYNEQKNDILSQFDSIRQITENNIVTTIKMTDNTYYIIEEIIRPNLQTALENLNRAYESEDGDIEKIDLYKLKAEMDPDNRRGLDYYIIDSSNVVIKTTYQTDMGLDFKKFPDLSKFFNVIRAGSTFVLDRLSVETLTGDYRIFAYLPTKDHKYILEAGCKLYEYRDILEKYNYMHMSEKIKQVNPLIEYIRVYDRHGHIFGNPDYRPTEEIKNKIFNLFYKRKGTSFNINEETRYFLFVDLLDPRYPTDSSKLVEVKYKTYLIKEEIDKALIDVFINGILLFLIALFISYTISYLIDYPISRMINEIGEISEGNLKKRISDSNIIELNTLAQNINQMVNSIEEHITKIKKEQEEKQRLEIQLRHSQKMEAVGLLAGGIAHDFNNIMSAILGYTNLLQIQFRDDRDVKNKLDQIVSAVERGSRLIRILLTFSRRQSINFRVVDLNEVVSNISKFLRRIIGEDIKLNLSFSNDSATVLADITNIEQVIMNLVTNARDAMPQGGELNIEIGRRDVNESLASEHNGKPGSYVVIKVSDTGRGIDKAIIDKIFDPFFTTKEVGKGTGLGLSVVYSIVNQHGGFIVVDSVIGQGTAFEIFFPYIEDSKRADEGIDNYEFVEGGSETLLLVEDDKDIRDSLRFILERYGYKVIEASNGIEGYETFVKNKDKIDLIISDVVMPELSGVKMYDRILAIKKDAKIIFMSGYNEEILEQRVKRDIDVIFKPVPPAELLKKIREALQRGP